jgi:hypothetical protein
MRRLPSLEIDTALKACFGKTTRGQMSGDSSRCMAGSPVLEEFRIDARKDFLLEAKPQAAARELMRNSGGVKQALPREQK